MSVSFTAGKQNAELGYCTFHRMKRHVLHGINARYYFKFNDVLDHIAKWEKDKGNKLFNELLQELESKGYHGAVYFIRAYDTDWTFSAAEVKEIAPLLDRIDFGYYEKDKSKREAMFAVRDLFLYAKKHNAKVTIC